MSMPLAGNPRSCAPVIGNPLTGQSSPFVSLLLYPLSVVLVPSTSLLPDSRGDDCEEEGTEEERSSCKASSMSSNVYESEFDARDDLSRE